MQFKKLLVFIAVLFSAVACIEMDKTLGNGLVPESEQLYMSHSEIDLPLRINISDSLQTLNATYGFFGAFNTQEYGMSNFATVGDISLSVEGLDLGKDHQVKSVYLVIPVDEKFALTDADLHMPQEINVYRTYKHIDSITCYNNSFTANDYSTTPLNKTPITFFGGDSVKFYLDHSIAYELLNYTKEQADSMELYNETHKGVIIKCSNPDKFTYGGRLNISTLENAILYIKSNFQPTWEEGLGRKDTLIGMYFTNTYALNIAEHESKGQVDLSNEQLNIPIEGIAGLKPYVDCVTLKETLDTWYVKEKERFEKETGNDSNNYNLTIGSATFYLPVDIPADYNMDNYPANIFPAIREHNEEFNLTKYTFTDDVWITNNPNGELNRSLEHYHGDISYYIRDLFMASKDELVADPYLNAWFMPLTQSEDSYGNITYDVDMMAYYKGYVKGNLSTGAKPRIKIMYVLSKAMDN